MTAKDIFAPAIELARDGFPLIEFNVEAIGECAKELKAHAAFYPDWLRTYTDGTGGVDAGPEDASVNHDKYIYGNPHGE